jgi:hypothetical protein
VRALGYKGWGRGGEGLEDGVGGAGGGEQAGPASLKVFEQGVLVVAFRRRRYQVAVKGKSFAVQEFRASPLVDDEGVLD